MTSEGITRAELLEFLPEAVEEARLGICVATFDAATGRYRLLYANKACADIFGVTIDQLIAWDPFSRIVPEDSTNLRAMAADQRRTSTHPAVEFGILRPNGERIRLGTFSSQITRGDARYIVTFLHDVTALETARRAERVSDTRFRGVTEASPDGIALLEKGRIGYANAAFQTLVGVGASDEGTASSLPDVLHGPVPADVPRQVQLPNGTWVEVRTVPLAEPDAELLFVRDLTEQLEIQEKLIHTDRLAAVGTLSAGIAHEINNPLAYVIANLELCLDQLLDQPGGLSEALLPRLQAAMQGAQRVRRIVRDLRTYSRESNAGEAQTVSLEAAISTALSMGGSEISRCAHLERDIAPHLHVAGMPSQVEQVFLNILLNAAQAFETVSPDNRISIRAREQGTFVTVDVEDNGPGIAPDIQPRIFDPFFTTKPVGQGTGLGLPICRNLVRSLGGQLELLSAIPGCTLFQVSLPKAVGSFPPVEGVAATRKRVLVIDDEAEVLSLLADALDQAEVRTARRVDEALEILRNEGPFDLVLCDVLMGEEKGPDVRRKALEIDPSLARHFVYMTGAYGSLSAHERAESQVLEKPFELRAVRDLLRTIAKRR
jgi:PAS domain S-box-containing protein